MTREEIIIKVRSLDSDQLERVQKFLDQLQDRQENRTDESGQDQEESEPGQ